MRREPLLLVLETRNNCSCTSAGECVHTSLLSGECVSLSLSRHHGPPLRQLHQMTRTGSYDTTSHERCSHNIQWPVETSISLPTPQHLRSPPHHLPPSPPSPESPSSLTPSHQAQPTLPPAGEGGGGKEVGRVVYVCGQPPLEAGDDGLIFESQFESGNLHQARRTLVSNVLLPYIMASPFTAVVVMTTPSS